MDINATVDIGSNLTSLVEKLAQTIGTTADKVYPWYVQQAYLEGITTIVFIAAMMLLALILFVIGFRKADFENGNRYVVAVGAAAVLTFFSFIGTVIDGLEASRKVMNPNYYAVKMMTRDIGNLTKR